MTNCIRFLSILATFICVATALPANTTHLAPYIGYRDFNEAARESSIEAGVIIDQDINSALGVRMSIGWLPGVRRIPTQNRNSSVLSYQVAASVKSPYIGPFQSYFLAGFHGHTANSEFNPDAFVGSGLRVQVAEDLTTFGEGRIGFTDSELGDIVIAFGFERALKWSRKKEKDTSETIATENPVVKDNRVDGILESSSSIYNFIPQRFLVTDIAGHWGHSNIRSIVRYGIMSSTDGLFLPEEPITQLDAAKMIVKTMYLYELLKNAEADIQMVLPENANNPWYVTLDIRNKEGRIIRHLLDGRKYSAGTHKIVWDGVDDFQQKVRSGDYQVKITLRSNNGSILESDTDIAVLDYSNPEFIEYSAGLVFDDPVEPQLARYIIDQSVESQIYNLNYSIDPSLANAPIKRIDFIIKVSKALGFLGANPAPKADLWLYRDKDDIPSYALNYLDRYIHELGYGGNKESSTLKPNAKINRAEAATIMNRILNWVPQSDAENNFEAY